MKWNHFTETKLEIHQKFWLDNLKFLDLKYKLINWFRDPWESLYIPKIILEEKEPIIDDSQKLLIYKPMFLLTEKNEHI